ncbi:MAG: DUF362 domain-containing protein [Clostridiaceae bacterium]|nr:DUF362 domain-containing protein [Clostridiaceae bacterium]
MRERRVPLSNVGTSQNRENESDCLLHALSLIQAKNMIKSDDVVVITPNFVKNIPPEYGVVTGNNTLRTLIRFIKELNPKRIVMACGSGSKETRIVLDELGITQLLRQESIEFIDLNHGPFTEISLNHDYPEKTKINTLLYEMTFHVSFTQLKQHEEAVMSACIKNVALSWPPAEEHGHPKKNCGIHKDLHGFIRSMVQIIPIDLSILSTMPAMVGTGPIKGVARNAGIVIAGTDPVSVDTIGARLLGYKPQAINYLYQSILAGVGKGKLEEIQISGLSIKDAEKAFSYAVYDQSFAIDE